MARMGPSAVVAVSEWRRQMQASKSDRDGLCFKFLPSGLFKITHVSKGLVISPLSFNEPCFECLFGISIYLGYGPDSVDLEGSPLICSQVALRLLNSNECNHYDQGQNRASELVPEH